MGEEQKRILQMLAEGKINVEEANRLLALVGKGETPASERKERTNFRYLFVKVEP